MRILLAVGEMNFLRSREHSCANQMNKVKEEGKENEMRILMKKMEEEVKQEMYFSVSSCYLCFAEKCRATKRTSRMLTWV
jgi:hypothetical protein